jgi:hypothetical protein
MQSCQDRQAGSTRQSQSVHFLTGSDRSQQMLIFWQIADLIEKKIHSELGQADEIIRRCLRH